MNSITLRSPAKLNLFLKVLNQRPDGFHNISTVFERISLCDELRFESNKSGRIRIRCSHPHVPTGPKNLVYKVARLIQDDLGVAEGVDVTIQKNIPVAAGLGGGSSNAATALLGLNKIWKLSLRSKTLLGYARQLGSDVPFFLYDCSWALGSERGDKIKRLNINSKFWHILVVPRVKMYSGTVYGGLRLSSNRPFLPLAGDSGANLKSSSESRGGRMNLLTKKRDDVSIFIHHLRDNTISGVESLMMNDLQSVVFRLSPGLESLQQRLKLLNIKGVMVSGSGPGIFGLTGTRRQAKRVESVLSRRFSQVFVVRTF